MNDSAKTLTGRRTLLQRGLALVAGVVGLGATEGKAQGRLPAVTDGSRLFTLHARRRPASPPAARREAGARLLSHGEILEGSDGKAVGAFYSNGFCMETPFGTSVHSASNLEFQTLNVPEGTLFGIGAPSASGEERVLAILGGTGRFAGARGSYVERTAASGPAGRAAIEFVVTLTA